MKVVRQTRQRQAVLEVLRSTRTHPDAAWVFQEVRRAMPNISLGTVYRSLDALASEGVVMVIERAGERARYDYRHEDHHHVVCRGCGAIFDVPPSLTPPLPSDLPSGFRVTEVVLEYHGLCEKCQQEH
ncbi:Fur family transcriptional regulator [Deinococcus yavapaiensis]|uniref:Fur family ferric uptake transcriptional regulator n=1 Tax=Deinococcus yavapaiensis KR-236 TaxID=694435 RepID=A0A318S7A9_9DEIO|nr:transcriptional repressor [Deinococcus yavapaiensis]PYE53597.1 Fur family ferric uptake transcriptional regulator [Deinococcus yavapaiensis KR-236]